MTPFSWNNPYALAAQAGARGQRCRDHPAARGAGRLQMLAAGGAVDAILATSR